MEKEVKSGYGGCQYLKFTLFAPAKLKFYCKKKQTGDFNCKGCPYKKLEKIYK